MFDFTKMRSRDSNFEVLNTNPSVCYYNPNYQYLDKNIHSINLINLRNRFRKKFCREEK